MTLQEHVLLSLTSLSDPKSLIKQGTLSGQTYNFFLFKIGPLSITTDLITHGADLAWLLSGIVNIKRK